MRWPSLLLALLVAGCRTAAPEPQEPRLSPRLAPAPLGAHELARLQGFEGAPAPELQAVVDREVAALGRCHLGRGTEGGIWLLHLAIGADGRVQQAWMPAAPEPVRACALPILEGLVFPGAPPLSIRVFAVPVRAGPNLFELHDGRLRERSAWAVQTELHIRARALLGERRAAIEACGAASPAILVASFAPDGSVLDVQAEREPDEPASGCLRQVGRALALPAPGAPTSLRVVLRAGSTETFFDAAELDFTPADELEGEPAPPEIAAVIDAALPGLVSCAGERTGRSWLLALAVAESGSVSDVKVDAPRDLRDAAACLRQRARALSFPPAAGTKLRLVRVPLAGGGGLAPLEARMFQPAPAEHGGLQKEVIGAVIRAGWDEVKACYDRLLATDRRAAGKVVIEWRIGPAGGVASDAVHEGTSAPPGLAACVRDAVRGWAFPAPEGGGEVVVTYPWVFRPKRSDGSAAASSTSSRSSVR